MLLPEGHPQRRKDDAEVLYSSRSRLTPRTADHARPMGVEERPADTAQRSRSSHWRQRAVDYGYLVVGLALAGLALVVAGIVWWAIG